MAQSRPTHIEANKLREISSQEDFKKKAKDIIAGKDNALSLGNELQREIKKNPLNACENFSKAMKSIIRELNPTDDEPNFTPEQISTLEELVKVVIIENLQENGAKLEKEGGLYTLKHTRTS